jgi:hypothetical protein
MSNDISERRAFSGPEVRVDAKDIKTGTDAIRARVWSCWRRGNFAGLARDIQVPIGDLEAFATGKKPRFPDAIMNALAQTFFYSVRYDAATDKLVDTRPPAAPATYVLPEPYDPASNPNPIDPHKSMVRTTPLPQVAGTQQPASLKRPGFA